MFNHYLLTFCQTLHIGHVPKTRRGLQTDVCAAALPGMLCLWERGDNLPTLQPSAHNSAVSSAAAARNFRNPRKAPQGPCMNL